MREGFIDQIGFICPRCRHASADGIVQFPLKLDRVFNRDGDFILEGFLVCSNPDCCCIYPILEGVPVVLKDVGRWWNSERAKLACVNSVAPEMREYFDALSLSQSSSYAERSLLSSYIDLHYGSPYDVPDAFAADPTAFWEIVVGMAQPETGAKYGCSLDLGCSVGRCTFELARFSNLAIGIDLNFSAVSFAARFHRTGKICYERRKHGHCFEEAQSSYSPARNVLFLVADALDPPFGAESFDLVAGLNLVDNVKLPLVLIGQMNALLQPGGDLILSSPYEWRADICEPVEWLETDALDAPAMVRNILEGDLFPQMRLKYEILQELSDVPWVMRHHVRYWSLFFLHLIKARKR